MIERACLGLFWVLGYIVGALVKVWRVVKAAFLMGYERGVTIDVQ
jgi:hypothetical protein